MSFLLQQLLLIEAQLAVQLIVNFSSFSWMCTVDHDLLINSQTLEFFTFLSSKGIHCKCSNDGDIDVDTYLLIL